ncbi:ESX-1 secretion system protein eccB1 [Actinocatenispora thailandica]|uniref:ESX-1 secretion system protein eccB1 n=1 Tax=Actinocatenispora thailandica TaxID=227318 RepID=A0A7R7DQ57_9ACTN|nr:type VII secretion protein EccB [Actinocatenispora thailandica]BCJ35641.1 ESX-1 secretion system protein eccB1 [Actinocatenispora thailandica]
MQTQRDHVHAYSFNMGRISSALVEGNSTNPQIPGRRPLTGLLLGVILAVLIVAGFGVYGWIKPGGSKAYQQQGAILVEKESGTRYVYLNGQLHPVPNLTSALLVQGPSATVKLISRESLKHVPRGPAIGIAGAPQTVPQPADLVRGPWLACLPGSVVARPGDGMGLNLNPSAPATALHGDSFSLAQSGDGTAYVVARGHKYPVTGDAVLAALGAGGARPAVAPDAWLKWLPTGATLSPPKIPNAGAAGPKVAGRQYPVGTLFRQRATGGTEQLFVLRDDGLAPIDRMDFLLATAVTHTRPVPLNAVDAVAAQRSSDRSLVGRLPDLSGLHWQHPDGGVLCVRQRPAGTSVHSQVVFTTRANAGVSASGRTSVLVAPGTGLLAVPAPVTRTSAQHPYLISDNGVAYPLRGNDTIQALRLDTSATIPLPTALLSSLQQGPALSRSAVTQLGGS